jgi:hypothetical protein
MAGIEGNPCDTHRASHCHASQLHDRAGSVPDSIREKRLTTREKIAGRYSGGRGNTLTLPRMLTA